MDELSPFDIESLDVGLARRIDAVCRRFETDWREGRRPPVNDHLADAPEEDRPALRAERGPLDCGLRQ